MTLLNRFLQRIDIDAKTGCWNWTGSRLKNGYGQIWVGGDQVVIRTHQLAYDLYCYPEREQGNPDHFVLHKCHNPACCNPEHLYLGSNQQNMNDMTGAGRETRGSRHRGSKLIETDIATIRDRYAKGESAKAIAKDYGVSPNTIRRIKDRDKVGGWTHV